MTELRERLQETWSEVKALDAAMAPLVDRRQQIEAAIISSFPTRAARNPNPSRYGHREAVARYTRDGIERRRELHAVLDAVNEQIAPLKTQRKEWSREVDHVKELIEAERERGEARDRRQQGELFE
jgi:hypothetical protein